MLGFLVTLSFAGGEHLPNKEGGNLIEELFIAGDTDGYRRHGISYAGV